MAKYCRKCDNTAGDSGNYCHKCGVQLVPLPKCDCGTEIWPWDTYCRTCGNYVKNLWDKKLGDKSLKE